MRQIALTIPAAFVAVCFVFSSCQKETDIQIKEVDKHYSWSEVPAFYGLQRVILSTGSNDKALYLQQPNYFTRFSGRIRGRNDFSAVGRLPSDVYVRLPIGREFFAYPATDSLLVICRNDEPLNYEAYVPLKRVDPSAIRFTTQVFSLSKCMAINRNNYLLAPYYTNRPDRPITFLLAAVTPGALGSSRVTATSRQVVIPIPNGTSGTYVRNLAAIEDYFLVNLGDAGLYKIRQDGTFRQVYGGNTPADAFYKWHNQVYAPVEYNKLLTSADNGDTWQLSTGAPEHFTLAEYYVVRDSLVGVYQNHLYTLRWDGPRFTSRFLKNDGLERTTITGVEYLRDTVYVATTSGLFARPAKAFFDSKP